MMLQIKHIRGSPRTRCPRQWSVVKAPLIRWDGKLGHGSCLVAVRKARGFNRPETGLPSYRILTCKLQLMTLHRPIEILARDISIWLLQNLRTFVSRHSRISLLTDIPIRVILLTLQPVKSWKLFFVDR